MTAEYEVFALRYATREARRHEHFIGGDPHDGPMPMDYFVWVAKNADRAVVIDIGFTAESGGKRGRTLNATRSTALALVGVDPADGGGRDPDPHALRPRRQLPQIPDGAVPSAGAGDPLRGRAPHAPSAVGEKLRAGRRLRHRAAELRRARGAITTVRPRCCPASPSCRPAGIRPGCSSSR